MTQNRDICESVADACAIELNLASSCDLAFKGTALSSCFCQPSILSLQYTCGVVGNVSCEFTSAEFTNLPAYALCKNLYSVLGTLPPSVRKNQTHPPLSLDITCADCPNLV